MINVSQSVKKLFEMSGIGKICPINQLEITDVS